MWISAGNKAEDFNDSGPKILVVLDNASFHKKEEILEVASLVPQAGRIKQEMPDIIWEFLPAYNPDYNIIELVWHSAKEYLANRLLAIAVNFCPENCFFNLSLSEGSRKSKFVLLFVLISSEEKSMILKFLKKVI